MARRCDCHVNRNTMFVVVYLQVLIIALLTEKESNRMLIQNKGQHAGIIMNDHWNLVSLQNAIYRLEEKD